MKSIVGVVPARGGSKGIRRKNLADVGGATLVARTVKVGLSSPSLTAIVVSSDDRTILQEAKRAGAEVSERPAHLATDEAPTLDLLMYLINNDPRVGQADAIVLLQPTSPFRSSGDIEECVTALRSSPTAATACRVEHPIEWTFEINEEGKPQEFDDRPSRRQDSTARFRLAGSVYAARVDHVRGGGALVGGETTIVQVPVARAMDIDTPLDLFLAQLIAGSVHDPLTNLDMDTTTL